MRFLPDGPSIPEELLQASDHGDVIFLCGAGVSRPAGLPGFVELARLVVEKLGVPADAPSRRLLERALGDSQAAVSLDQIFQNLKYEYGPDQIDEVVSDLLDPGPDASTEQHALLLKLSKNAARRPQIVTTNFDLLFERAEPSLAASAIIAPNLPDLASGQPLEGIVYLHGRRKGKEDPRPAAPLIVSSADFGRAYLAQGWATKFMTDLLRHYTIILVGYSANDPPVRYLLEGIHALGDGRPSRIYAFDRGSPEAVQARWRDRGVRVLAYPDSDTEHASLWGTLREWSERAEDVERWRRSTARLASQKPSVLHPHQRGQIASLLHTDGGAKAFRESDEGAPAEWLCVFDRNLRYAKPYKGSDRDDETDSLALYGLDDDPPRPEPTNRDVQPTGVDLIRTLGTEAGADRSVRLAGGALRGTEPITARLFHLAHWIARVIDDPVCAWWAAGYETLHPRLIALIEWRLDNWENRSKLHPLSYRVWRLLLERFHQGPRDTFGERWFPFARMLKTEGWTARVLREFDRVMTPRFASRRPGLLGQKPPVGSWDELRLSNLASFEVTFLRPDSTNPAVPTEVLSEIFGILRRGLERAAGMLADIDTSYWRTTTFMPEDAAGQVHLDDLDKHLLWIVELFDRLAAEHVDLARAELTRWPSTEPFFFDKLHLYAWSKRDLGAGREVAAGILRLTDASFWNSYHRRELLHVLAERWSEIDTPARERIEARIIAGPPRLELEPETDYTRRKAISSARILGWLASRGACLGDAVQRVLPELRAADARWQPSWDERADASAGIRSGYVHVDSEPVGILDAPLAEIIARAAEHSGRAPTEFTTYDPFKGLVERRPRRALSALSYEARRDQYPTQYWQTVLQCWPEGTSTRLLWTVADRLARLPSQVILELRFAAASWYEKHLPELSRQSLGRALQLWDKLLAHLSSSRSEAAESALGDTYIGGQPQGRSRRTHGHAINSPVGRLARTLLTILERTEPAGGAGIPEPIRARFVVLLASDRTGRDYSISEMTSSLTWLHHVDPEWASTQLIPLFEAAGPDAEPAWSGYQYDRQATPQLFALLKPHFLKLFPALSKWRWDEDAVRHFSELVVIYCFWRQMDERYLSYAEARSLLQQTTDAGRSNAAWSLARVVRAEHVWASFGKPFLLNGWPRERRLQTSATSTHLAEVSGAADGDFPDAVSTLLPLLVPIDHPDVILHEVADESSTEDMASKPHRCYPEAYLALIDRLIGRDSISSPYGLGATLQALAEAAPSLRQDSRWRRLNDIASRS
jgi:hypothetical protein